MPDDLRPQLPDHALLVERGRGEVAQLVDVEALFVARGLERRQPFVPCPVAGVDGAADRVRDERGSSAVVEKLDLEQTLLQTPTGVTVADAAVLMFEKTDPSRNEIEKAHRRLQALVTGKHAVRNDDPDGNAATSPARRTRDPP